MIVDQNLPQKEIVEVEVEKVVGGEYNVKSVVKSDGTQTLSITTASILSNKAREIVERTITDIDSADLYNTKVLGSYALYGCTKLSRLDLPEGLEEIGYYACSTSSNLGNIVIPSTVKKIGNYAFYGSGKSRYSISFASNSQLETIGDNAFSYASISGDIILPEGLKSVGNRAFNQSGLNYSINYISIPNSIEEVGSEFVVSTLYNGYTEYGNAKYMGNATNPYLVLVARLSNATDITVHKDCKVIARSAGVGNAEQITFEEDSNLKYINYYGLNKCKASNIVLPNTLLTIGERAIASSSTLQEIIIPDTVTKIDTYAFSDNTALTKLVIGEGVINIGTRAFSNNAALTEVIYNAKHCADLTSSSYIFNSTGTTNGMSVIIGDTVERIPAYLFDTYMASQKANITSLTIGQNVKSIGTLAFEYGQFTEFTIKSSIPPSLESTNAFPSSVATIYIPTGSLEAYSNATNWSSFVNKFVEKNMEVDV